MMNWCLKRSTPITAMAYEPFQPLTAAFLGIFFIRRRINSILCGGILYCCFWIIFMYSGGRLSRNSIGKTRK